jgi:casein kinase II subunit beta
LQVDREFIEDNFNLYGLRALVPHYNEALDMILDIERMDEAFSDDRQVISSHTPARPELCHLAHSAHQPPQFSTTTLSPPTSPLLDELMPE